MQPVGFRLTHFCYFDVLIRILTIHFDKAAFQNPRIYVSSDICMNLSVTIDNQKD